MTTISLMAPVEHEPQYCGVSTYSVDLHHPLWWWPINIART